MIEFPKTQEAKLMRFYSRFQENQVSYKNRGLWGFIKKIFGAA